MNRIGTLLLVLIVASILTLSALAGNLTVVKDYGMTTSISPYLGDTKIPSNYEIKESIRSQLSNVSNQKIEINNLLYPCRSNFTPGKFTKHKLNYEHFPSTPIFIIGNDTYSINWARENAAYLKKIHAFGIITNVGNAAETQIVEDGTALKLMSANINGWEDFVGTKHYPLLVYKNWVLQ